MLRFNSEMLSREEAVRTQRIQKENEGLLSPFHLFRQRPHSSDLDPPPSLLCSNHAPTTPTPVQQNHFKCINYFTVATLPSASSM